MTLVRRGPLSNSGRGHRRWSGLPIARIADRRVATSCGPMVSRARPGSPGRARYVCGGQVEGGGLPAERGQLARERDRDHAGGLVALTAQHRPALMQTALRAPGDLDHPGVLAVLAARQAVTDAGWWR